MKRKVQVVICAKLKNNYQVLLLQTNKKRGQFWQNVTGSAEKGESYREAAEREALEETGFKEKNLLAVIDLREKFHYLNKNEKPVEEKAFAFIMKEPWKVVIDPKEHQAFKWLSIDEIDTKSVKHEINYQALLKLKEILC